MQIRMDGVTHSVRDNPMIVISKYAQICSIKEIQFKYM